MTSSDLKRIAIHAHDLRAAAAAHTAGLRRIAGQDGTADHPDLLRTQLAFLELHLNQAAEIAATIAAALPPDPEPIGERHQGPRV